MTLPARIRMYYKPERSRRDVDLCEPAVRDPSRILLSGDTHGYTGFVRQLLDCAHETSCDAVFVLGDFGIWNHVDGGRFTDLVSEMSCRRKIPVLFLPGNHDNYDLLFEWEAEKPRTADGFYMIKPEVYYSPRGHRWTWGGTRLMSLGGAYSIDKYDRTFADGLRFRRAQEKRDRGDLLDDQERYILRTGQYSWWVQEEVSQEELDHALRPGEVDILLTHDKPKDSIPGWNRKDIKECWRNQEAVQEVVDAKKPKLLMHGHLHYPYGDRLAGGTLVKGLDCDPETSLRTGGSGEMSLSMALLELGNDDSFALAWEGECYKSWEGRMVPNFLIPMCAEEE